MGSRTIRVRLAAQPLGDEGVGQPLSGLPLRERRRYSRAMGFYYRRSIDIGPFRVNVGSRGVGYSVGGRGFRVGRSASGRRYTSFGLPGTGLGYRSSCALFVLGTLAAGFVLVRFVKELCA